jgi:hypothetical protein
MSLATRAQTAHHAVTALAANGPGFFKRRERAAREAIQHFVGRALSLPDNAGLPSAEREELTSLIEVTIAGLERYLGRPGEKTPAREASDREFATAVYALKEAEERVSQRNHFAV